MISKVDARGFTLCLLVEALTSPSTIHIVGAVSWILTCLYVNKLSETEPLDFGILSPYLHIDYCETNGFEQHPSVPGHS